MRIDELRISHGWVAGAGPRHVHEERARPDTAGRTLAMRASISRGEASRRRRRRGRSGVSGRDRNRCREGRVKPFSASVFARKPCGARPDANDSVLGRSQGGRVPRRPGMRAPRADGCPRRGRRGVSRGVRTPWGPRRDVPIGRMARGPRGEGARGVSHGIRPSRPRRCRPCRLVSVPRRGRDTTSAPYALYSPRPRHRAPSRCKGTLGGRE